MPSIGADISKPLNPFRHWLQYCLIQIVTPILIYISGASFTFKDLPADYTKWLGPGWREELLAREKPIPTIVMNHLGWLDNVFVLKYFNPAFVPRGDVERIPIFGAACKSLGHIFAHRSSAKETRDLTVSSC